jgi:hypothetical protein
MKIFLMIIPSNPTEAFCSHFVRIVQQPYLKDLVLEFRRYSEITHLSYRIKIRQRREMTLASLKWCFHMRATSWTAQAISTTALTQAPPIIKIMRKLKLVKPPLSSYHL